MPVGNILFINDVYDNNEDQTVSGTDFALYYNVDTGIGGFNLKFNATKLREYFIELTPGAQEIQDALDAGLISDDISVSQEGDIIRDDGQPKCAPARHSAIVTRQDLVWVHGISLPVTSLIRALV